MAPSKASSYKTHCRGRMRACAVARLARHPRCLQPRGLFQRTLASRAAATARQRVAVIGTGRMGVIRVANVHRHSQLELAAIVEPSFATDSAKAAQYAQQYATQCFATIEDARHALEDVHGVWIATPTPTHAQLIQETLRLTAETEQLRAIGIEKPVAGTLNEIDQAYRQCFARRVPLVCSFQRRFDPSYQSLRRQVRSDAIGRIQSVHTVFRDHPCPPVEFLESGGDPFHDLAVHDIDFVCSLVGEYPTRVYAFGTSLSPVLQTAQVMDKASVWLEFERSGVVCTMDLSRRADYGYDQRIEVAGERGMLQVLNPPAPSVVRSTSNGSLSDVGVHSFPERFRDAYALELDEFIAVMREDKLPTVHWNAARMATIVAEAARIAATHRRVVTLRYTGTRQDQPELDPYLQVEYEY